MAGESIDLKEMEAGGGKRREGDGDSLGTSSIALSRYTLYHSALDLNSLSPPDDTALFSTFSSPPSEAKGCITFCDGRRSVDFVLAYLNTPTTTVVLEKRKNFEERLEAEGLELEREVTDRLHVIKIHAPREVLKRYCEILRIRLPMKSDIPGHEIYTTERDLMTDVKSFFSKLLSCVHFDVAVFPPQEFNLTAEYSRNKSYLFDDGSPHFFSSQIKTIVVDFILERAQCGPCDTDIGIGKLINEGVYRAAYPLHDGHYSDAECLRGLLLKEWAQVSKWAMYQPIDQVRDYFGVKFGLYFAWLGFYTHMLIPASIVGLLSFVYGCLTLSTDTLSADICDESLNITMCPLCDGTCDYWRLSDTCTFAKATYLFDNPVTVIFAVFMSFWAALFIELWKRYSASIAHRWGLTDFCLQSEPPRPPYLANLSKKRKAKVKTNVVTGAREPYAPFWTVRLPATLLSFSVVILLVFVAVMAVFGVVLYRMSVLASISLTADQEGASKYTLIIIPVTSALINLICILALNYAYDRLAVYLTELELLRTQTEFDESLTIKIYLFQFVNYYSSIMYIAFLKGKFVGYPYKYNRIFKLRQEECNPGGCLMELSIQLAVIMVGQQALNGCIEMIVPYLYKWFNTLSIKAGLEKKSSCETLDDPTHKQWTEDYKLLDWGPRGLFYEYLEMVMQYGFVTIFVSAFPLAPFFALINNVFEMRLDARKFLIFYRRPVPKRAPNIGVWFRILNVLGRMAIISNAFIIAFSSNFIPKLVYSMTVSPDGTDAGYLNHTLALFNTDDFEIGAAPRFPSFNVTTCRYSAYRHPPSSPFKYKRTSLYWHVLAARLAFIVIFQNVVSVVMVAVEWIIPDVSPKLKEQMRKESFLTSELIIRHETAHATRSQLPNSSSLISAEVNAALSPRSRGTL